MSEMIGVTYLQVSVAGVQAWHLALFYQDSAGNKAVIEAAPQNNFPDQLSWAQAAGEVAKEGWSIPNVNNGSPFGLIVGGARPWSDAAPFFDSARPREVLLTDPVSLRAKWDSILADAAQKFSAGYEYRPLQQNSNTFAGTLLRDAGIDLPTGFPIGMSLLIGR